MAARTKLRRLRPRTRGCPGRRRPVSLDLQKMIWDDREVRGQSKFVLLHLASYVPKESWDKGRDLRAWPSQNTVAIKCGIPRSSVERALANLTELEKIRDTGIRRQRGTVVWELYPSTAPAVTAGWEMADLPDSRASHLPDYGASRPTDLPDDGAGAETPFDDLPDSRHDLPDPQSDLPDDGARTCPTTGHKREVTDKNSREIKREKARGARGSVEGEDLSGELAQVEKLLERRPEDKLLSRRREELKLAIPLVTAGEGER